MRDAVAAVDYGSCQRALAHLSGGPGGGQRQDGLGQNKGPQMRLHPETPPSNMGLFEGRTCTAM